MNRDLLIKINSLRELITALRSKEYQTVLAVFDDINIKTSEIEPFINWSNESYTRNCIAKDENFELLLLCWEPHQQTQIHCHSKQQCWVKVIEGAFKEEVFEWFPEDRKMKFVSHSVVTQNDVTNLENLEFFHSLENTSGYRALSLHLYIKPIISCRIYNHDKHSIENVVLTYDYDYSLE